MKQRGRLPPGTDERVKKHIRKMEERLDLFDGDADIDLKARAIFNARAAVQGDEYVTLDQLRDVVLEESASPPKASVELDPWELLDFWDDFLFGQNNWYDSGNPTHIDGELDHPGILNLATGAVNGDLCRIHSGATSTSGSIWPADISRLTFIVRPGGSGAASINNNTIVLGCGVDVATTYFGNHAMGFRRDTPTDNKVRAYTRAAGVATETVVQDDLTSGSWYKYDLVRYADEKVEFFVNDVLLATHTANLPTAQSQNVCAFIQTHTNSSRQFDIDFARIRTRQLSPTRWS